jgi:hypothetical protein
VVPERLAQNRPLKVISFSQGIWPNMTNSNTGNALASLPHARHCNRWTPKPLIEIPGSRVKCKSPNTSFVLCCKAGHDPWASLGGVKSPVEAATSASAPAQPLPWKEFDGAAAAAMATDTSSAAPPAPAVEGAPINEHPYAVVCPGCWRGGVNTVQLAHG